MNVPEMQRLIDHLRGLPPIPEECFAEMDFNLMAAFETALSCGTVGCIEGEWRILNGRDKFYDFPGDLGLSDDEHPSIIFACDWVGGFRDRYRALSKRDPNAERALMIEYLEWIVADPERFSKAVEVQQAVSV